MNRELKSKLEDLFAFICLISLICTIILVVVIINEKANIQETPYILYITVSMSSVIISATLVKYLMDKR